MSELGYLLLTCPVCIRIASDLDVKDHTAMDKFLDDVKSYNTKPPGILLLHKNMML